MDSLKLAKEDGKSFGPENGVFESNARGYKPNYAFLPQLVQTWDRRKEYKPKKESSCCVSAISDPDKPLWVHLGSWDKFIVSLLIFLLSVMCQKQCQVL